MFKKPLSFKKNLGLLTGLSLFALAACGQEANEPTPAPGADAGDTDGGAEVAHGWTGAMENFQVGDQFTATVPIDVSLLFRELPDSPWQDDWLMVERLRDLTNVNFAGNTTAVLNDDFGTQRQLLIATGNAPEIMPFMYAQYVPQFVPGGALLPISKYWEHMPNFQHFATEWGLWDDLELTRMPDGHIYHLPGMQQDVNVRFSVALRYDILNELGLDVPDSWDEIREVLRVVAEEFPEAIPFHDRWNMDSTLNFAARTFDVRFGWGMGNGLILNHETGQYEFITQIDGLREFTEYWHSLIDEELLNPESFAGGCDPAWQAFVNGDTFMIGAQALDASAYMRDMQENIASGVTPGVFGLDDPEVIVLPIPNGPTGMIGASRLNNGLVLNNSLREREDFIAILQFVDWLWYSEEGREFAMWGIEGETFEWVDGQRQLLPGFRATGWGGQDDESYINMPEAGFNQNVFLSTPGGSRELMMSIMTEDGQELHMRNIERVTAPANPNPPFDEIEQEQASIIAGQLTDMVNTGVRQFIVGHRDLSEWDDFIAEVEASGVDRLVDLANEALARQ